jgi:peroxiredoxin
MIGDESFIKKTGDSLINNKIYSMITINAGKRRIQNLGKAFDSMTTKYNIVYKLLIDKESYLPFEVLQKNDIDEDYIKTTFLGIEANTTTPPETSWYYSTYTPDYKPAKTNDAPQLAAKGTIAPDWKLKMYEQEKTIALSELKGNVVLLYFWIKNCGVCIESVPFINGLHKKLKNKNFKIAGVNAYDAKEDVGLFYAKYGIRFPVLLNGKSVAESYGVNGFPTVFVMDKEGKIIYAIAGLDGSAKAEIEKVIDKAL